MFLNKINYIHIHPSSFKTNDDKKKKQNIKYFLIYFEKRIY